MEVLKNLSEYELTCLRDRFLSAQDNAISLEEFEEALTDACVGKPYIKLENLRLRELFNDIDINGDNTVSWDEFTMFLIEMATQNSPVLDEEEEGNLKKYSHIYNIRAEEGEIPNSIVETRYLPKVDKVMKIMRRDKSSRLKICLPNRHLTNYLEVPRISNISILSAEHVPLSNIVHRSGSIAVSYSDSVIRFYDLKKSPKSGGWSNEMPLTRETRLIESQTVMRWSSVYNRMILGSRSGVVSVLDVDQPNVLSKEKLHGLVVLDMKLQDSQLFTASLDPNHSVKCVDLHRSVVKFSLNSHSQGATLIETDTHYNQLFSVGFELSAHIHSITMPRLKPYRLHDTHRPHKGRIIGLTAVPGSPQVLTADTTGLVKVWDLRTYTCVQSIYGATNEQEHQAVTGGGWTGSAKKSGRGIDDVLSLTRTSQISSIGYIPALRRLIVNGRETNMFQYEDASCPHLSDDNSCNIALYNPISHTFLTVHNRTLQIWDAVTGSLRGRREDVVSSDITAVALAIPLARRFFAGTLDGTLYSIGYATGTILRKFDRCYTLPKPEDGPVITPSVVDMQYLETFRESKSPYLLVGFAHEVILVPDAEEHIKKNALSLHCFDAVLKGKNTSVTKVATSKGGCVVIGTTNGMTHVADMNNFSLIYSWGQQHLRGEVVCLDIVGISTFTSSSFAFVADTSGRILAVLLECVNKWEVIHKWDATSHTRNLTGTTHTRGRGQISRVLLKKMANKKAIFINTENDDGVGKNSSGEEGGISPESNDVEGLEEVVLPSTASLSAVPSQLSYTTDEIYNGYGSSFYDSEGLIGTPPLYVKGGNGAVTSYFSTTTKDALIPVVTGVVYLKSSRSVVSADDRGVISVWGVSKLVDCIYRESLGEHQRIEGQGGPKVHLIAHWKAHDEEVTSLSTMERGGKSIILSSSNDKKVLLWSLDGVLLGNLAQGRAANNQIGDVNKNIYPFLVDNPPAAAWECFDNYNSSLLDSSLDSPMERINNAPNLSSKIGQESITGNKASGICGDTCDLRGDGSFIFLTETTETSGGVPRPQLSTVINTSIPLSEAFNLEETSNANKDKGSDSPKTPPHKLPRRFKGLVSVARPSEPKSKIGQSLKCRDVSEAPLMHRTLPPIYQYKSSYFDVVPLRESDERQILLSCVGGVPSAQQPVHRYSRSAPPTQVPVAVSSRDYVTQDLCPNSKTLDNYSTIKNISPLYAGSNLIGQECLRPSKPCESVTLASISGSARDGSITKKIGNPLATLPKSAHRYLSRSGIQINPFETEIERDMRVKGHVVLGKLSSEASNRLL